MRLLHYIATAAAVIYMLDAVETCAPSFQQLGIPGVGEGSGCERELYRWWVQRL